MGVFLIYHNKHKKLINELQIIKTFEKKGLEKIDKINTKEFIFYIGKNLRKKKDFYSDNNYDIYSFGTFIYKSKSKGESLKYFLKDFLTNRIDENSTFGIFQLLIIDKLKGTYELINDRSNIYDLYYLRNYEGIISNSFVTLFKSLRYPFSIDKKSLAQNVFLGYIIGQGTLINEIKKHSKNKNYKNKKDQTSVIKRTDELIDLLDNIYHEISISFDKETFDIGLSGGYDSRLNLILGKDKMEFSAHTHIKKTDKRDYNISKILADKCKIELKTEKSEFIDDKSETKSKKLLEDTFYFYDGRVSINTGFLNDIYSRNYRENIVKNSKVSLSGFGGEIFRNYNNIPKKSISINSWLYHFVVNPFKFEAIQSEQERYDFKNILKKLLLEDDFLEEKKTRIGFNQMFDYYPKIWLKYVLSVKIFTENQLLYYLMPLIDYQVINQTPFIRDKVKKDNFFEAKLINSLSKGLSDVTSNYGYNFSEIPKITRMKNRILTSRTYLRVKAKLYKRKEFKSVIEDQFILKLIDKVIEELDYKIKKEVFLSNKTWALNIASIGYLLSEINNNENK